MTIHRSGKRNIDTARKWRRRRKGTRLVFYLGAGALVVAVVWSIVVMIQGPGVLKGVNHSCNVNSAACGTVVGFVVPVLSVALASAVFLFYRLRHVRSPILRRAKTSPQDLVETATPNIGQIVGRDELCQVIMEDVRQRDIRRPHILVGGVGAGKTAVLVRLTKLFADRGAIPVPVRLRDASEDLDFSDLAYGRFRGMTENWLLSENEAERVWRQLRKDDKIVVIADGLEEALTVGSAHQDRDNRIRLAIHRARELGVPLIVASRPHDPLRGADATIMELEPLSEEAALEYIDPASSSTDARRLDWIVETAGLTELPLYLQITRQLSQRDRLDHISADRSAKVDTRSLDRSTLRLQLLDTWMEALFDGHLRPAVPLSRKEREAAVTWLSALACIGLQKDTIDVKFEDYYDAGNKAKYDYIEEAVQRILEGEIGRRQLDIRLAVAWGDRLALVEAHGDGLRFPHSIMQAYLGARFMGTALKDGEFGACALKSLENPGREFLISLVLYSRSKAASEEMRPRPALEAAPDAAHRPAEAAHELSVAAMSPRKGRQASRSAAQVRGDGTSAEPGPAPGSGDGRQDATAASPAETMRTTAPPISADVRLIRDVLLESAEKTKDDIKKLDLYAATLEIDSSLQETRHLPIAESLAAQWREIRGGDQRTLDEAKIGLVLRFGEAVRATAGRPERNMSREDPAYREFLGMGLGERSYPIRLAIAQEIGAGGDDAFRVLHKGYTGGPADDLWRRTAWPDKGRNGKKDKKPARGERSGLSKKPDHDNRAGSQEGDQVLRGRTVCAWLAPLLVGSVDKYRDGAKEELRRWLDHVGRDGGRRGDCLPISLEVALAQGFKYAANRRRRHPHARPETMFYLQEQALGMLRRATFWFTQLTLIQALCLWEMPDPDTVRDARADSGPAGVSRTRNPAHRHGSNPGAIVDHWLGMARNADHPFVREAGKLAVRALQTGRPQRFLWIDESGIVSSVGSRTTQTASYRKHHLWIPPSAGWAALNPRAQQLVADVLLMLNLAERGGDQLDEIEERLSKVDGSDLPPCLTKDRDPLDPRRTVGGLYTAPGSNCIDGCRFGLCPYPPKGGPPYRSELNEAFCRGQQTLLTSWRMVPLIAPWQVIPRRDMKRFWTHMADRARDENAHQDRD